MPATIGILNVREGDSSARIEDFGLDFRLILRFGCDDVAFAPCKLDELDHLADSIKQQVSERRELAGRPPVVSQRPAELPR